jgi:hypothetical protein
VGADDDRGTAFDDVAQQFVEERAALVVERRVGLVEQPQFGTTKQQPGQPSRRR